MFIPLTRAILARICRAATTRRLDEYAPLLTNAAAAFDIDTPRRMAAWLAQLAHESGEFRYVREIASGQAYDVGRLAVRLGNTPEDDDDGEHFKGRGLIQITGRNNYAKCGAALGLPLLDHPELLEDPQHAAHSAGWYWKTHGLNELADADEFLQISVRINGRGKNGLPNGWAERQRYWARAREALGVTA